MDVGTHHSTSFIMNHANWRANTTFTLRKQYERRKKTTFSPSFGNNLFSLFTLGRIHPLPSQNFAGLPQILTLYLPALGLCLWYPSHIKMNYISEQELLLQLGEMTQLFCPELPDFPIQVRKTSGEFLNETC